MPTAGLVVRDPDKLLEWRYARRQIVEALGLPTYHLYDAATYFHLSISRARITTAEHATVKTFFEDHVHPPCSRCHLFGAARGANVIVVMAEALQAFVMQTAVKGDLLPRLGHRPLGR